SMPPSFPGLSLGATDRMSAPDPLRTLRTVALRHSFIPSAPMDSDCAAARLPAGGAMTDIETVLNDGTWVERSLPAEDLTPKFSFVLRRTVYMGDPNSVEQLQSDIYNPPITIPELAARDPL